MKLILLKNYLLLKKFKNQIYKIVIFVKNLPRNIIVVFVGKLYVKNVLKNKEEIQIIQQNGYHVVIIVMRILLRY